MLFMIVMLSSLLAKFPFSNDEAQNFLTKCTAKSDQDDLCQIPLRSDGSMYRVEDLAVDQKEALADVLHAVRL